MRAICPVAVITGASRGLGREVALALAKKGYRLAVIARNCEQLNQLTKIIISENKLPENLLPLAFTLDVADNQQVTRCVSQIMEQLGRIDVVFNNAGVCYSGTSIITYDEFYEQVMVNLVGAFNIIHAIVPYMKQQRSGYIINVSSRSGKMALPNLGGYAATKYGLVGLNEALFKELAVYGIKVTALCPSYVPTAMTEDVPILDEDKITLEDIVQTILYLLSLSKAACIKEIIIECTKVVSLTTQMTTV